MAETLKDRGFFWWFDESNHPANSKQTSVSALLTISDDGQITLDVDGTLCRKDEFGHWTETRILLESRRIAGQLVSGGEYILLEGLERTDFAFADESPQQQQFTAQMCTRRGTPFPKEYGPDNFVALRVELTGFEDWLELDSFVVDREYVSDKKVQLRVSCNEPELKYPTLGGSISIESVTTGAPLLGFDSDYHARDVHLRQHHYLVFVPDSPSSISRLRHTYIRIEELLALLVGSYTRAAWPILVSKEEPFDEWNTLHFHRMGPSGQSINRSSIWVPFAKVRRVFGDLFWKWIEGSESLGAGYYLYVSSLRNAHFYVEDRFVNLVWGVEALHRKCLPESEAARCATERERVQRILDLLPEGSEDRKWLSGKLSNAHEPSLRERILQCLGQLPFTFGDGELAKFAKACASRRNDISHFGGPRENADYEAFGAEIFNLAGALGHLVHALILHHIGIDSATILEVMTHSSVSHRIIEASLANVDLHIQPQGSPSSKHHPSAQ